MGCCFRDTGLAQAGAAADETIAVEKIQFDNRLLTLFAIMIFGRFTF